MIFLMLAAPVVVDSDEDETRPLYPHAGRFKLREDSSDTDSSDVDSIVMARDVKRKLRGYSDSDDTITSDDDVVEAAPAETALAALPPPDTAAPTVAIPVVTAAASAPAATTKRVGIVSARLPSDELDETTKFGKPKPKPLPPSRQRK